MGSYAVGTDGTTITSFDYDADTVTKDENGFATIDFTITGSFVTKPDVKAFCEGSWISRNVTCSVPSTDGTVTGSVKVKPTTAYVDDVTNGKLTLYVPYYSSTGIGQVTLTAEGSASLGVTSKEGNDTKVTISVGIDETPKDGERLTVKAMHDDGTPVAWLHMGPPATKSGGKITQELKLDEYILTAEEASNASPRSCTIAIYSPSGREVGRQQIVQNPIINLASSESANCYIISSPGRYMIPARKGNSNTSLWSTRPSNLTLSKPTDDGKNTVNYLTTQTFGGEDYIIFNVPNTISNGNTVIALNSGTTLWSWHLWFCEDGSRPENSLNTYVNGSKTYSVMNRAIGATETMTEYLDGSVISVWTDGLYYQWGRKDPMLKSGNTVVDAQGSYANSIQNPSTFYSKWTAAENAWNDGDKKTINDPCPPGYRVPSNSIWKDSYSPGTLEKAANAIGVFSYNLEASTNTQTAINYPYSYYLQPDGKLKDSETEYVPFQSGYSFTSLGRESYTIPEKIFFKEYQLPVLAEDKFTMNNMEIQVVRVEGRLWGLNSSSQSYLYYFAKQLDLTKLTDQNALEDLLRIGEYKHERRVVTDYDLSFNTSKLREIINMITSGNITDAFLESVAVWGPYNEISPSMSENDRSVLLADMLVKARDGLFIYDHTKINDKIDPAEAAQIRCVKD